MHNSINIKKTMLALMSAYMVLAPVNAQAQMTNITIKAHENQSLIGKKFRVHALFMAEDSKAQDSIEYTINPVYETLLQDVVKQQKQVSKITNYEVIDYIASLKDGKEFRNFIKVLNQAIVDKNIEGKEYVVNQVDASGNYTISNLKYGYYLIQDASDVQGKHTAASLTMVQTSKPNLTIEIKQDYPAITKKVFEDDQGIGWNDVADYEIDQLVPFQYETRVPSMEGYETYTFKIHDEMDPALSLQKDSIEIVCKEEGKTYTLQPEDYNVSESENAFTIEIKQLKQLVQREFEGRTSQKVIVRYKMKLNDQAGLQTGRPGYENKVRLEYSNHPYSNGTGFTPWDTNVVFTYKVDVKKINDAKQGLQGAEFKLYSDSQCKQEVYMKKAGENYVRTTDSQKAETMISNETGHFEMIGLDQGTYYLKETKAPKGYRQLLNPIEIRIQPTFSADRQNYVENNSQVLESLKIESQGVTLETNVEEGSGNLSVVNSKQPELPFTGSSSALVFVSAGCVLIGVSCLRRRKH